MPPILRHSRVIFWFWRRSGKPGRGALRNPQL